MKKKSPFKSTLTGGIIVLSLFSFMFFLIGVFVYKTVYSKSSKIEQEEYTQEEVPKLIYSKRKEIDTVKVFKTDTVIVFKTVPVQTPQILAPTIDKKIQAKDTKTIASYSPDNEKDLEPDTSSRK